MLPLRNEIGMGKIIQMISHFNSICFEMLLEGKNSNLKKNFSIKPYRQNSKLNKTWIVYLKIKDVCLERLTTYFYR